MAKTKKPKRELRDTVVDLDSRPPHIIVDMEADIFRPPIKIMPTEDIDLSQSEYQKLLQELQSVNDRLVIANEKLTNLRQLFRVKQEGSTLDRSYKIVFNDMETEWDEIGTIILDSFIEDYSLDISQICRDLRITKDSVEARSLRGARPYCEVDLLFDEKKEPVQC